MGEQGDHAAAEAEYREVLAAKLRVLGPDHPDTLATRHGIALEMGEQGDHAAAEAEYREVLAAKLRVLGPDHPDTLTTRHQHRRGDRRARRSRRGRGPSSGRCWPHVLRVLGPDHPSTQITSGWVDHLAMKQA